MLREFWPLIKMYYNTLGIGKQKHTNRHHIFVETGKMTQKLKQLPFFITDI